MYLKFFDLYVSLGLKPIAIQGKRPLNGKGWNRDWSIEKWRPFFENETPCNMGILLGDIVDVEGDTPEANDILNKMLEGIPHPKFKSCKSTHHLFLTPDKNLTRRVFKGIEFRGKLHQSVVPPSIHENGVSYNWLTESEFPIPKMPEELTNFYFRNCQEKREIKKHPLKKKNKEGYRQTKCNICKKSFFIHIKRLKLEVAGFSTHGTTWACHGCRQIDLRDYCRSLREHLN